MVKIRIVPADNGVTRLSSKGEGRHSANIPATHAIIACRGPMNKSDPKNAKVNPEIVPSRLFFLLKKREVFPKVLPKTLAKLSPSVSMAIDV